MSEITQTPVEAIVRRRFPVQLKPLRHAVSQQDSLDLARRFRFLVQRYLLFFLITVLPTLLVGIYIFLFASHIYVSEARYVVRTPSDSNSLAGPLSGIVQSTGVSKSTDDAHAINAFLLSRDAMELLRQKVNLDAIYGADNADVISRFPRPFQKLTREAQFKYFLSMTSVIYDKSTGISTLAISAFTPKDAQLIARELMRAGEALANRLTVRMREDLSSRAAKDADEARSRAIEIQERITSWRNREQQLDPTRYSAAIIEVIARLSFELAQLQAQRSELLKASPQGPSMNALQNRINALEQQIAKERQALVGGTASLAPKIVEYELLQLDKTIAEKLLAATISALETARSDAQKQQIYLERIVEPQLPDYPRYPRRYLTVLIVAIISFLFYVILIKVLGNIAGHGAFARYFWQKRALT
ncbi:hypothetical protein [Rhabdaerophilum sp.]|uniref:hypothetical protein n=1 Tax=Rhabdaerophilum sp. TaxID=2717341 RepID=UPI0038D3C494